MKSLHLLTAALLATALANPASAASDSYGQKMKTEKHATNAERKADHAEQHSMKKQGDDDSSSQESATDGEEQERDKMKPMKDGKAKPGE